MGNACSERREKRGTENKKWKNSEINNGYKVFNNKRFMLDKMDHQSNISKIFLYLTLFLRFYHTVNEGALKNVTNSFHAMHVLLDLLLENQI